eukprot:TRINITY_DN33890_c0_g1_i1.p1 TRINITY_DN33890_c0_g1~~TRINITY_DN33890_c0_g1_i1.p1  ORF type:complete len:698 (+),score=105.33 TRINITY_DN33890_c0_g1_i1:101-2194(+)
MEVTDIKDESGWSRALLASNMPVKDDVVKVNPAQVGRVFANVEKLRAEEAAVALNLEDIDVVFCRRRRMLLEQRELIRRKTKLLNEAHDLALSNRNSLFVPPPPSTAPHRAEYSVALAENQESLGQRETPRGARCIMVGSKWFVIAGLVIITTNFFAMVLEIQGAISTLPAWILELVFLLWYLFELVAKVLYQRRDVFCGLVKIVWLNYVDAIVLASSVTLLYPGDVIPVLPVSWRALPRFLRVVWFLHTSGLPRVVLQEPVLSKRFHQCILCVISVDIVCMSIELSFPWMGWDVFRFVFFIIYTIELILRTRAFGLHFFKTKKHMRHNFCDCAVVAASALDVIVLPLVINTSEPWQRKWLEETRTSVRTFANMIRLERIVRVEALSSSMRDFKNFFRVVIGMWFAVQEAAWVFVFMLFNLYVFGIAFTSFIGRGYAFEASGMYLPEDAVENFGTVSQSMFSLFCYMNDNIVPMMVTNVTVVGRLLNVAFRFISNNCLLAVITSVASNHMMRTSRAIQDNEERTESKKLEQVAREKLYAIMEEICGGNRLTVRQCQEFGQHQGAMAILSERCLEGPRGIMELFDMTCDYKEDHVSRSVDIYAFTEVLLNPAHTVAARVMEQVVGYADKAERRLDDSFRACLIRRGMSEEKMRPMAPCRNKMRESLLHRSAFRKATHGGERSHHSGRSYQQAIGISAL